MMYWLMSCQTCNRRLLQLDVYRHITKASWELLGLQYQMMSFVRVPSRWYRRCYFLLFPGWTRSELCTILGDTGMLLPYPSENLQNSQIFNRCIFIFVGWQYFSYVWFRRFCVLWGSFPPRIHVIKNFEIMYEWSHQLRLVETDPRNCQGWY